MSDDEQKIIYVSLCYKVNANKNLNRFDVMHMWDDFIEHLKAHHPGCFKNYRLISSLSGVKDICAMN